MAAEIGQISLQVCSSRMDSDLVDSDLVDSDLGSLMAIRLLLVVRLR
jgi:hypothetical protein